MNAPAPPPKKKVLVYDTRLSEAMLIQIVVETEPAYTEIRFNKLLIHQIVHTKILTGRINRFLR
jgi:hypothetical protein